ncbi:hypothetical protein H1164_08175 [Thermoactinomyces daqus]|uniref:Uncharacterized protein n=1 Tax=Thermoactinomyces daqus TaxID=1329516 RepID=A0A7W1XA83_9BACL|nr:hypothetical protein [Thermoactinomyces daqus]MBA4542876.1 hypothetical protein [Thermoactinomyces daqus]
MNLKDKLKDGFFHLLAKMVDTVPKDGELHFVSEDDFNSIEYELYGGHATYIDLTKFEDKTKDKAELYDLSSRSAPKCSFLNCKKKKEPPRIFFHGRLYHLDCFLNEELIKAELSDDIKRLKVPVGIVVLKNEKRIPILWDFRIDTIEEYEQAKEEGRTALFFDPTGSPFYLEPENVLMLKRPVDASTHIWSLPPKELYDKIRGAADL